VVVVIEVDVLLVDDVDVVVVVPPISVQYPVFGLPIHSHCGSLLQAIFFVWTEHSAT
jgi:hypothetical protein